MPHGDDRLVFEKQDQQSYALRLPPAPLRPDRRRPPPPPSPVFCLHSSKFRTTSAELHV